MFLHELNEQQKQAFICLAHDVVVSDGELSPLEDLMMQQLRREIGLSDTFEPHYISLDGVESIFDTHHTRVAVVIALIRLGYADGAFEIEEQSLLSQLCRAFEITEQNFMIIENWVKRLIALEKEARTFMS